MPIVGSLSRYACYNEPLGGIEMYLTSLKLFGIYYLDVPHD